MKQTVMLAGDADTNCAIVGGLIGAYYGITQMPKEKIKKVLECDVSKGEQSKRPDCVKMANGGFDRIMSLLSIIPSKLELLDDVAKK